MGGGELSVKETLASWGMGKRMSDAGVGFPPCAAFARMYVTKGEMADRSAAPLPLPESEHLQVDAVVSLLKHRKPQHHEIICRAYISGQLDGQIGRGMRLSRSTVRTLREAGEAWIEAKLDSGEICSHIRLHC